MTAHLMELWLALFAVFTVGAVGGWLIYRWIDRTDYAYDQRDLADRLMQLVPRRRIDRPQVRRELADPPVLLAPRRAEPVPAVPPRPEPLAEAPVEALPRAGARPAAGGAGAEVLRDRVRTSRRAAAWHERRGRQEEEEPLPAPAMAVRGTEEIDLETVEAILASLPDLAGAGGERDARQAPPGGRPVTVSAPRHDARIVPPAEPIAPIRRDGLRALPSAPPRSSDAVPRREDSNGEDAAWPATRGPWPPVPAPYSAAPRVPLLKPPSLPLAPPPSPDDIWGSAEVAPELIPSAASEIDADVVYGPGMRRPPGLPGPPTITDDLKRIRGIGLGFESRLNRLGIYRFAQIAAWTPEEQSWIGARLGSKGRIERDAWVRQAATLAGADT